ncbi:hypothetical protein [Nitrospira sp. Nam74]
MSIPDHEIEDPGMPDFEEVDLREDEEDEDDEDEELALDGEPEAVGDDE